VGGVPVEQASLLGGSGHGVLIAYARPVRDALGRRSG
jgi:hypothetical protein